MLLILEKGIRSAICHAIHRYVKANNKCMKDVDANNLYGWTMSQKLPVNGFKWKKNVSKFEEDFMKNYNVDSNNEYILEVDVEYLKHFLNPDSALPFLAERKKIKKCKKLLCNINDKEIYVVHIRALKQALNHGLKF